MFANILQATWHMKRENLSPAWTTDIHNLLKVSGGTRRR